MIRLLEAMPNLPVVWFSDMHGDSFHVLRGGLTCKRKIALSPRIIGRDSVRTIA